MMFRMTALALAGLLAACGGVKVETASPDSDLNTSDSAVDAAPADSAAVESEYDFTLTDTDGNSHSLGSYLADGKTVVLEWFNPGCPYVVKYHEGDSAMRGFAEAVAADDVVWLAVNSGAPGKQGAGLEMNKQARADWNIPYPVLLDESGEVGRLFGATNTPHMFVLAPSGELIYQGAIDDTEGRGDPAGESFVSRALADFRAGEAVTVPETKAFGCSVKYAH